MSRPTRRTKKARSQTPSVAVIAFAGDPHLTPLLQRLVQLGARPVYVDLSRFPAAPRISLLPEAILVDGVDLAACGAALLRQVGYMWPMPARQPNRREWGRSYEEFAAWMAREREVTSFKYSLVSILADLVPVVNPVVCFEYHQMKPLMFATLAEGGVPVPTWVAGNAAGPLKRLAAGPAKRPRAVVKPLAGGTEVVAAKVNPRGLAQTPRLYQAFARGRNVRAYVIGNRVVAAALIEPGRAVDWRVDARGASPLALPAEVKRLAVRAARLLGMRFAALDLVLTRSGPRFLDVNPTPMFSGFEQLTGLDVATPLAEYLVQLARRRRRRG